MIPHIREGFVGKLEADPTHRNTHIIPRHELVEIFWLSNVSLNGNKLI